MGAKKIIHEYNGILMDSNEEVYFAHWLDEAKDAGWVEKWAYVTKPFLICPYVRLPYIKTTQLKTKVKEEYKEFTLLHDLEYTPDFKVKWTDKGMERFVSYAAGHERHNYGNPKSMFFCGYWQVKDMSLSTTTWVEVKPKWDFHQKTARFSVIQKVLWHFKHIFVDLIIPEDLFRDTFLPKEICKDFKYKKNPTGKQKGIKKIGDWKVQWTPKTLAEYIK